MSKWKEYRLEDFAVINPTERIPKGTIAKKIPMEIIQPFTKRISGYSKEKYNGGVKFKNGDTLMARITPSLENGKTSYVHILDEDEIGFGSTEFIVLREKENVSDKHFLYYLAISPTIRFTAIKSMTGSSGRQRVQTDVVKEHVFDAPEIEEQRAIASVLSSLDHKIALLHRQSQTLEQMAETLFRQWFPANAGQVVEEADEEWEDGFLGDILKFNYGKSLPTKKRSGVGYPVYGSSGITDYHAEYLVEGPGIVTGRKETLGVVMYSFDSFYPIDTTFYITNNRESSNLLFDYFLLKKLNLSDMNTDSAVPGLNRGNAEGIEVSIPPQRLIEEFESIAEPIFQKIKSNQTQIRTLTALRDTLLPKLMSGEVRVQLEENN